MVELSAAACVVAVMPLTSAPEATCAAGRAVALVRTRAEGVPRAGVISVGEVENTRFVLVVPVVPVAALR